MKTSLLLLSLVLSAMPVFAQETVAPVAPYSSISKYPEPATPTQMEDKKMELTWERSLTAPPFLTGRKHVRLKKGQNLIVSIQTPSEAQIDIGTFKVGKKYSVSAIIYHSSYFATEPCNKNDKVLVNQDAVQNTSMNTFYFHSSYAKPIVFCFRAGRSAGSRALYFNVNEPQPPTSQEFAGGKSIAVTVEE